MVIFLLKMAILGKCNISHLFPICDAICDIFKIMRAILRCDIFCKNFVRYAIFCDAIYHIAIITIKNRDFFNSKLSYFNKNSHFL